MVLTQIDDGLVVLALILLPDLQHSWEALLDIFLQNLKRLHHLRELILGILVLCYSCGSFGTCQDEHESIGGAQDSLLPSD